MKGEIGGQMCDRSYYLVGRSSVVAVFVVGVGEGEGGG